MQPNRRSKASHRNFDPPSAVPSRRIVIRHVPFRTFLRDEEVDTYFETTFLDSEPTQNDLAAVTGYAEYKAALAAIQTFVSAAAEGGSPVLAKRLLLHIIHELEVGSENEFMALQAFPAMEKED